MSTTAYGPGDRTHSRRNLAQWFCLVVGLTLVLAGLLGFIADATFDTSASGVDAEGGNQGGGLQGDLFLGLEVNGWHNLVHIASGLLLLAGAGTRRSARTVAIIFGLTYAVVTIIGLIDGTDVLGILPVNVFDNVLHALLAIGALAVGLGRDRDDHADGRGGHTARTTTPATTTATPTTATTTDGAAAVSADRVTHNRL